MFGDRAKQVLLWIGALGPLYYMALLGVLGTLAIGYDPIRDSMGELGALGSHVQTAANLLGLVRHLALRDVMLLRWLALAALLVTPLAQAGTSGALLTDAASVAGNAFAVSCFAHPAYVYSQTPAVSIKQREYEIDVEVTIRYDSNGDCVGTPADEPLDKASLVIELRDEQGLVIDTAYGKTNRFGVHDARFTGVPTGEYQVSVTSVEYWSLDWEPGMDVENPVEVSVP